MEEQLKLVPIKCYTHQDLMHHYGVAWSTLQKWIKPFEKQIGEKVGHFYTVKQVRIIFENLGHPELGK